MKNQFSLPCSAHRKQGLATISSRSLSPEYGNRRTHPQHKRPHTQITTNNHVFTSEKTASSATEIDAQVCFCIYCACYSVLYARYARCGGNIRAHRQIAPNITSSPHTNDRGGGGAKSTVFCVKEKRAL